ncbi:hypothetical protein B0J14DRAFT_555255 [Halenospora varia]|nr:hypothetical protein B0J14DRAFT_555255 [Halenospora varia]
MAAEYSVETYLLDKTNVQDTMHCFDTRDTSTLINSVYAPEVQLDYDPVLGGSPEVITSETWAKRLEHLHDPWDETQHIVHNILIELPQPSTKKPTERPDSCTVFAYAHGWFYNRNADGYPRLMARRQGGRYKLEVVRLKDLEEKGENPWRVSKQHVRVSFQDLGEKSEFKGVGAQ